MSEQSKKQSFLGGAAILAGAVAVVKVIGALYKLPLNNILGDVGKTYFQTAYEIYNVLLTVSTAGLPLAISKLTSQAHAQGRDNEKRKLFRTAIWLFFGLGVVGSCLMFFGAQNLADFQRNSMAAAPIRALAPAVFCVCVLSCMRGYTQGQGNMTPTAVSQVLEALCKLGIGLSLAWYILKKCQEPDLAAKLAARGTDGMEYVAAGAIFGVTVGTILSLIFLVTYLLRHRDRDRSDDKPHSSGYLLRRILAIGVPITLGNCAMSIITMIDTKIILGRLQSGLGLTEVAASALKGQYSYAMDMLNMVSSFVYPVTMSLLPFAAAALARGDNRGASRTVNSAFRILAILALPAGVGLSVLSTPIMVLVLPAQREGALAAGPHLKILGIACIFVCLMILTNAILQTYGKEHIPILTVIAGGLVKIVMNYVLVGNPTINIHGAPWSTLCCYAVIAGLNLFFVWKYSPRKPHYFRLFARPVFASAIMGVTAWAVCSLVAKLLSGHSAYGANAIATLCGILAGVAVYGVLVIALGLLRADDVKNIRGGQKLIRLLHLR